MLALGSRLFADRPYDSLSMDDIAREGGVAKGLVYYYFGSKRGFYTAVIENIAKGVGRMHETGRGLTPYQRIRANVLAYLEWAQTHRAAFQVIISGGVGFDAEVGQILERERLHLLALLTEAVLGRPDGPPALRAALDGWMSLVERVTIDWLAHDDLSRAEVEGLVMHALGGALAAARHVDPAIPDKSFSSLGT